MGEQRNLEACPWVMMVGKGEDVGHHHADRVHDKLDAIENGEGRLPVKMKDLQTLPKAPWTQALTALTSNFGLVGLV